MIAAADPARPALPGTAAETTRENPWPVRALAQRMAGYLAKAPAAWIEGQVAQIALRPGTVYLTLRDPAADISMQVSCLRTTLAALPVPPTEGARVVVHGKYDYYAARGTLNFKVDQIHPVGLGELLARLERVRQLLAAEGLTASERKKRLPFLPATVGLITGRASAAESDVLANARARWPAVQFRIAYTAVQGVTAVPQILDALRLLDADPDVEVIVLARGGGSTEDLLPFSDETLCRAVARCHTPVVSAIGHEPDHPIVDDVADVRCSTPTDAGKRVVPDAVAELRGIDGLRGRARRALAGWVRTEQARLGALTSAAVLADAHRPIQIRTEQLDRMTDRGRQVITATLDRIDRDLTHRRAQLAVLGPAATLARGYAVVQVDGSVLRSVGDAPAGAALRIRVADGAVLATSTGAEAAVRAPESAHEPAPAPKRAASTRKRSAS